ncbi:MAG: hypothetical protein WKF41_12990 [Gaiellaceae bacterium]
MAEVPDDVNEACQSFLQGDLLQGVPILEVVDVEQPLGDGFVKRVAELQKAAAGSLTGVRAIGQGAPFGCVVSQTCDVVQPNRRGVQIAPVAPHEDPEGEDVAGHSKKKTERRDKRTARIEEARSGRQPHIIYFEPFGHPAFPAGGFIDLKTITTIQKPVLASFEPIRFIDSEEQRRKLAFRCAHIFERPALPDAFNDGVAAPLRAFLIELSETDPGKAALLKDTIGEEWLALDDPDDPKVATVYFLGENAAPPEAQEILDEWWESASSAMPGGATLLPNEYKALGQVSLAEARVMNLITYWYLSDES